MKELKLFEPSILEIGVYFKVEGKEFAARMTFDGKDNPSEKRIRDTWGHFGLSVLRTLRNKKYLRTHKDRCECLFCWNEVQHEKIEKATGKSL